MIFDKIQQRIVERNAGKFSAKVSAIKGAEPVVIIGAASAFITTIAKLLGVDISEQTVAEIGTGAVAFYGLYRAIINWIKNSGK
jgi:hypothetical protein